jgi:predicted alpha/beta hydrolase family esterase
MSNSIYLIHGYLANSESHWFPWLKNELQKNNKKLMAETLTNADNPEYHTWKKDISNLLSNVKKGDSIVCHSLGCISTLDFFKNYTGPKLDKLILVAGFNEKLKSFPDLDNFINECQLDLVKTAQYFDKIIVFVSSNDVIVDPILTRNLAKQLSAELIIENNAGHFLESDGYTKFDSLLKLI